MIWTGTTPRSLHSILREGVIQTERKNEFQGKRLEMGGKELTLSGIFIDMSSDVLFPDLHLAHDLLINTHGSNHTQRPRIDLPSPVAHNTHNFLPSILAPSIAPLPLT